MSAGSASINRFDVHTLRVPTDLPEADDTLRWEHTDAVIVEISAGDATGIGLSYGHAVRRSAGTA